MDMLPQRRRLHHSVPSWVETNPLFFVTFCTLPRGRNQLCQPAIGPALLESCVIYHQAHRWWVRIFLLMPDHVHALVAMPKEESLETRIRLWKSYQTKNHGISWQTGFFEHRLRSCESQSQKIEYIRMNPVRAGLVARPEDWPYVWQPTDI